MVWPAYIQKHIDSANAAKEAKRASELSEAPAGTPATSSPGWQNSEQTTAQSIINTPTDNERQIWGNSTPPLTGALDAPAITSGALDPTDRKFYANNPVALQQWDDAYAVQREQTEQTRQEIEAAENRLLNLSEREREHLINPATGSAFTDREITEGMINALERRRNGLETTANNLPQFLVGPRMELRGEIAQIDAELATLTTSSEPTAPARTDETRQAGAEATRIPISETIIDNQFGHTLLLDRGGRGDRYQVVEYSDGSKLLIDTQYSIDGVGAGINFEIELAKVGVELGGDFEFIERVGDGNAYILHPGWEDAVGTEIRTQLAINAFVEGNTDALEALSSLDAMLEYQRKQTIVDAVWESTFDDVHDVETHDFSVDASVGAELLIGLDLNAGVGAHQIVQTDQNSDARIRRLSLTGEAGGNVGLALTGHGAGLEGNASASIIVREDSQGDIESFDLDFSIGVDGSVSGSNPFSTSQEGLNEITNKLLEESLDTPIVDVLKFEIDDQHADGYELRLTLHVPNNTAEVGSAVEDFLANPNKANADRLIDASGDSLPTLSVAVYSVDRDVSTVDIGIEAIVGIGIDETNLVEQRTLIDGVVVGPDGIDRVNSN